MLPRRVKHNHTFRHRSCCHLLVGVSGDNWRIVLMMPVCVLLIAWLWRGLSDALIAPASLTMIALSSNGDLALVTLSSYFLTAPLTDKIGPWREGGRMQEAKGLRKEAALCESSTFGSQCLPLSRWDAVGATRCSLRGILTALPPLASPTDLLGKDCQAGCLGEFSVVLRLSSLPALSLHETEERTTTHSSLAARPSNDAGVDWRS